MARILIIDDDDAFRAAFAETLNDLGHQPIEAASGRARALKYWPAPNPRLSSSTTRWLAWMAWRCWIHRAIEKKLKSAGLDLSATEALFALKSLRVVDIALADGSTKRCVTQPTQRVAAILRALGISAIKPPTPPQHDKIIL